MLYRRKYRSSNIYEFPQGCHQYLLPHLPISIKTYQTHRQHNITRIVEWTQAVAIYNKLVLNGQQRKMANRLLNTGWTFQLVKEITTKDEIDEDEKLQTCRLIGYPKGFIPFFVICGKKLRQINVLLIYVYCCFLLRSDRLILEKTIKMRLLVICNRWPQLLNSSDHLKEDKLTVEKGRKFRHFENWPLSREWSLYTSPLNRYSVL